MMQPIYTMDQVAHEAGCNYMTVWRNYKAGKLRPVMSVGNRPVFLEQEVKDWIAWREKTHSGRRRDKAD